MRSPQNFNSIGIPRSRFEYGVIGLVLIISLSSELEIVHQFFIFYLLDSLFFNRFIEFFLRRSTDLSGLLANDFVFGIFGARIQVGSSLSAPNGIGG